MAKKDIKKANWSGRFNEPVTELVKRFTASIGFDQKLGLYDIEGSMAHAEMLAITMASDYIGGKFLNECTLYVTLEPCLMCAGACYWGRFKRIVVGAKDEKRGFKSKGDNFIKSRIHKYLKMDSKQEIRELIQAIP